MFGDAEALHTETILGALRKISEAPWDDYFGRPLTARDLARLLKPYGVASVDVRLDGVNKKGYRRNHLHDPWTRYLPGECDMGATSATSATEHVNMRLLVAGSGRHALPATRNPELTSDVAQVAQVAEVSHASSFCDEVDRAFPDWRRMAGETGP